MKVCLANETHFFNSIIQWATSSGFNNTIISYQAQMNLFDTNLIHYKLG